MWVLFKAALFQTKHQLLHVELKLTWNNAWTLLRGKTTVCLRGQKWYKPGEKCKCPRNSRFGYPKIILF